MPKPKQPVDHGLQPLKTCNSTTFRDAQQAIEVMKQSAQRIDAILASRARSIKKTATAKQCSNRSSSHDQIDSIRARFKRLDAAADQAQFMDELHRTLQDEQVLVLSQQAIHNNIYPVEELIKQPSRFSVALPTQSVASPEDTADGTLGPPITFIAEKSGQNCLLTAAATQRPEFFNQRDQVTSLVVHELLQEDQVLSSQRAQELATRAVDLTISAVTHKLVDKALNFVFPVPSASSASLLPWKLGNFVCRVHARKQELEGQWGNSLTFRLVVCARKASNKSFKSTPLVQVAWQVELFLAVAAAVSKPRAKAPEQLDDHSFKTICSMTIQPIQAHNPTVPSLPLLQVTNRSNQTETRLPTIDAKEINDLVPELVDVFTWGNLPLAALAQETTTCIRKLDIHSPFPRNRIVQACSSRFHTLLRSDVGILFSFGAGSDGALGHDTSQDETTPRMVEFFLLQEQQPTEILRVADISCGGDESIGAHSAAITRDGQVFTWGSGVTLGIGTWQNQFVPHKVHFVVDANDSNELTMQQIVSGNGFCMAISSDARLFAWGRFANGRLGLGAIPVLNSSAATGSNQRRRRRRHENPANKQLQQFALYPRCVESLAPYRVDQIACGEAHCVALASLPTNTNTGNQVCDRPTSHTIFVWGKGSSGQLGTGTLQDAFAPIELKENFRTSSVGGGGSGGDRSSSSLSPPLLFQVAAAGQDWSMVLDNHGHVWTWGALGDAVLGHGLAKAYASMDESMLLSNQQFLDTNNLTDPELVMPRFQWLVPNRVETLTSGDVRIQTISAGSQHAAALSTHGDLYLWGHLPFARPSSARESVHNSSEDASPETQQQQQQQQQASEPEAPEQEMEQQRSVVSLPSLLTSWVDGGIGEKHVENVFCGGDSAVVITTGSFLAGSLAELFQQAQEQHTATWQNNEQDHPQTMVVKTYRRTLHVYCDVETASDVRVLVDSGVFYAHQVILARRSVVLRDLIFNEQRHGHLVEILLPSLRYDVAQLLLEFIYTDNLSFPLEPQSYLVRDLHRAARLFQLQRLEFICDNVLNQWHENRSILLDADQVTARLAQDEHDNNNDNNDNNNHSTSNRKHQPMPTLAVDLQSAINEPFFTDLLIVAEHQEIHVHQCILQTRSDYFRGLLRSGMGDATTQIIHVEESFWTMLRVMQFIYSDHFVVDQNSLLEVLVAADKYALPRMKQICEHVLDVTVANCLDTLVVAELVDAPYLRRSTLRFIVQNLVHVLHEHHHLTSWKAHHPQLYAQLFAAIQHQHHDLLRLDNWQRAVQTRQRDLAKRKRDFEQHQQAQWRHTWSRFPWLALASVLVAWAMASTVLATQPNDLVLIKLWNDTQVALVPLINGIGIVGAVAAGCWLLL